MPLIHDFFALTWRENALHVTPYTKEDIATLSHNYTHDFERFCDSVAILLLIHDQNLEKIAALPSSKAILNRLFDRIPFTKETIQRAQKSILSFLIEHGDVRANQKIAERLEYLRKEEIIPYDISRRLMSWLRLIDEKKSPPPFVPQPSHIQEEAASFHDELANAKALAAQCVALYPSSALKIAHLVERLEAQRFGIGVTGVMNAGKSTLLNALLGEEILGTSVVPETANLTCIRYATTPHATVHFWTQAEWERIEEGAKSLPQMRAFVEETKAHFSEHWQSYITPQGRVEPIAIETLPHYTSAKTSQKRCNLIKEVDLALALPWLSKGVVIVDTPGLDDPVIQREEITLSHLNQCDVLIHLMNAAQAATHKDVEFIVDALMYRNVVELLVVITRIDMISESELLEVMAYTTQSIKAYLHEHHHAAAVQSIIDRIRFLPVSGKLALWHRLGEQESAVALGYDLAKTGIEKLEAYLHTLLFGASSPKVRLTLASFYTGLYHAIQEAKRATQESVALLSLDAKALQERFEEESQKASAIEAFVQESEALVQKAHGELEAFAHAQHHFITHKIDTLKALLVRRIVDDVRYEWQKHKRHPKQERIIYMLNSGIKDGIVDTIRSFVYAFEVRMRELSEPIEARYHSFAPSQYSSSFDAKTFCETAFASMAPCYNNTVLHVKLGRAIMTYAKEENLLLEAVQSLIAEGLQPWQEALQRAKVELEVPLLEGFKAALYEPMAVIVEAQKERLERLENQRAILSSQGQETQEVRLTLQRCLEGLEALHINVERRRARWNS